MVHLGLQMTLEHTSTCPYTNQFSIGTDIVAIVKLFLQVYRCSVDVHVAQMSYNIRGYYCT